ncbi:MAG: hypothetical protein JO001_20525 [Alphaproteobacteria bacterium]|nr:hypothetical protein [Alphaproteobacteria bacterium]
MDRLYDETSRLEEQAIKLLRNLPEDIQHGPSVMLAEIPDGYDDMTYSERNQILELKRCHPDQVPMIELVEKPCHFYSEEHLRDEIDRRDIKEEDAERMVAEWRPKKERVARVREEIGHTALLNQAKALHARASELNERIEKMEPPRTLAGIIALIEMTDYEMDPVLVSAHAGLRAMAAGDAA